MIISRTPLRVSLFGGGTDFKGYYEKYEGAVVSMTINKFIHIIVKPNTFNDQIILNYFEKEAVDAISQIKHPIIREALNFAGIKKGIEITSLTDVPLRGTGLGSSSSFAVGLLNALFTYQGKTMSPFELAEMASTIEIDIVGSPIGKQDQYAAAFGGLKEYVFEKNGGVRVGEIPISDTGCKTLISHMILFHTGIERQASTILSDQKQKIGQHLEFLHELKGIALKSKTYFIQPEVERIGALLNQNWEYKKKLSQKVQNDVIEKMYRLGMEQGAFGGKVLGAGGGGFICFICQPELHDKLRVALADFKEFPISFESLGSQVFRL